MGRSGRISAPVPGGPGHIPGRQREGATSGVPRASMPSSRALRGARLITRYRAPSTAETAIIRPPSGLKPSAAGACRRRPASCRQGRRAAAEAIGLAFWAATEPRPLPPGSRMHTQSSAASRSILHAFGSGCVNTCRAGRCAEPLRRRVWKIERPATAETAKSRPIRSACQKNALHGREARSVYEVQGSGTAGSRKASGHPEDRPTFNFGGSPCSALRRMRTPGAVRARHLWDTSTSWRDTPRHTSQSEKDQSMKFIKKLLHRVAAAATSGTTAGTHAHGMGRVSPVRSALAVVAGLSASVPVAGAAAAEVPTGRSPGPKLPPSRRASRRLWRPYEPALARIWSWCRCPCRPKRRVRPLWVGDAGWPGAPPLRRVARRQ